MASQLHKRIRTCWLRWLRRIAIAISIAKSLFAPSGHCRNYQRMRPVLHRAGFVPVGEIDAMRSILAAILSLLLGIHAGPCRADDFPARPASADDAPVVARGRPVPV